MALRVAILVLAALCVQGDASLLLTMRTCPSLSRFNFWGALGRPLVEGSEHNYRSVRNESILPASICLLSIFRGPHEELRDVTLPNKIAYARRHGYRCLRSATMLTLRMFTEMDFRVGNSSDPWMSKLELTLELMENRRCKWIFWCPRPAARS
jgi:hypothetical protein